jgi:hypothetical protein
MSGLSYQLGDFTRRGRSGSGHMILRDEKTHSYFKPITEMPTGLIFGVLALECLAC